MNEHALQYSADHGEVIVLLPWYANGSLRQSEQLKVTKHLEACAQCRQELAECRMLQCQWQNPVSSPFKLEAGLMHIMDRIGQADTEAEEAGLRPVSGNPFPAGDLRRRGRRLSEWLRGLSGFPKPMLALASVAGAMLLALVTARPDLWSQHEAYRTLGLPSASDGRGFRDLQIVFAPSANVQQVMELIRSINGRIVDGPTQPGVFTVRLNGPGEPERDISSAVRRLRDNPLIILVEPLVPPA